MAAASPLPILGQTRRGGSPPRSGRGKWRALVLLAVHGAIALHIAHWWRTGRTLSPLEPSEGMALGQYDVVNAGLLFFLSTIVVTALFGRFFCGWGCHLLALQDASAWILRRVGIRPRPLRSRLLAVVPFIAFVYMFLWPAAYRLAHGDVPRAARFELTTSGFWDTFPDWPVALATFGVCGFLIVYLLGQKAFCTYACPYGGIFALVDRLAPVRIRVSDACEGCGHCTAVCTSDVRVHEEVRDHGMVVDPGCMKCTDCVAACPNDALRVGWGRPAFLRRPASWSSREVLPWREELVAALGFTVAFFVFRGLYEKVPFLFALGLAGIVAFLELTLLRLGTKTDLRLRGWRLKRAGELTTAGLVFVLGMGVLFTLQGHSAVLQWHRTLGMQSLQQVSFLGSGLLDGGLEPPVPTSVQRDRLERAVGHLSFVADRGLLTTRGLAFQLTWMNLLLGEEGAFERRWVEAHEQGSPIATLEILAARHHARKGRIEDATAAYGRAVQADAGVLPAHVGLGVALARMGELVEAAEVLEVAAARFPGSVAPRYNLGVVFGLQGRREEAMQQLARALEVDPLHRPSLESLAGLLAVSEPSDPRLEYTRRALSGDATDVEVRAQVELLVAYFREDRDGE